MLARATLGCSAVVISRMKAYPRLRGSMGMAAHWHAAPAVAANALLALHTFSYAYYDGTLLRSSYRFTSE